MGCTQPIATQCISQGLDLDALNKLLYHAEPQHVRSSTRARRASRSAIYDRNAPHPPTPWLRTVPLPHAEDYVAPSPHTHSSHSRTSSIDNSGSWSPDASFLQKYAALPKCTDESDTAPSSSSKGFPQETGTILVPELAKECRLKWDVRNMPNGASFRALPGIAFARPDLNIPALSSEIKSVSISFDAPRAEAFKKGWGCILVRARSNPLQGLKNGGDRRYETITVFDLMNAICKYFNERLSSEEIAQNTCSPTTEALLKRIGAARLVYTGHSKEGDRYRRVDLLDEFRFRSLKVDTMSGDWCHLHLRLK